MRSSRRSPFRAAAVLVALAPALPAQGPVQLTFAGALEPPGGARVAVGVSAGLGKAAREVLLDLHLARGTSGADLAALLAQRLRAEGLDALAPASAGARAHVFVQDARAVVLELGEGLSGAVTVCAGPPALVRVVAPRGGGQRCRLVVTASALHAHTAQRTRSSFEVSLEPGATSAQASERLFQRAVEAQWVSERPGLEAWRPAHLGDGARLTGFGVELLSGDPWRLEVRLPEPP